MIFPLAAERLEQVQAAMREVEEERRPELANVGATVAILSPGALDVAGRTYTVAPTPFREGLQLLKIQDALSRLPQDASSLDEMERLIGDAVALFGILARPTGWRRLVWRVLPNPFARLSEREVGELLGFFSGCRMRSRVRHPS